MNNIRIEQKVVNRFFKDLGFGAIASVQGKLIIRLETMAVTGVPTANNAVNLNTGAIMHVEDNALVSEYTVIGYECIKQPLPDVETRDKGSMVTDGEFIFLTCGVDSTNNCIFAISFEISDFAPHPAIFSLFKPLAESKFQMGVKLILKEV